MIGDAAESTRPYVSASGSRKARTSPVSSSVYGFVRSIIITFAARSSNKRRWHPCPAPLVDLLEVVRRGPKGRMRSRVLVKHKYIQSSSLFSSHRLQVPEEQVPIPSQPSASHQHVETSARPWVDGGSSLTGKACRWQEGRKALTAYQSGGHIYTGHSAGTASCGICERPPDDGNI